jgi:mono/diheme cytochrome c family protein/cytochrome c1
LPGGRPYPPAYTAPLAPYNQITRLPATLLPATMRICLPFLVVALPLAAADKPVDYTRQVRPVLANSCLACHGPDEKARKAKLRLDVRTEAVKKAIVPGKGAESPFIERVTSKDPDEVMPPAHAKKPAVTPEQAALLKRWIDEGAKYDQHWAYVKPVRPAIPDVTNKAWVHNPVDAFIAQAHERHGFAPAPEADKVTLIRRLTFDLLGLPPTVVEVDAFLKDNSAEAYEKVVDRLLGSKHFGERMAVLWLDAVRYADTGGYHSDNHRDVWLFRDYVIDAFNKDKRFDQFVTEQLAGDLLPNPTNEQKIASGYNRMLMTTEEGGAQPKEYTAKYAADRVRNTSNAFLGSTMGCCECHDHKYDPFRTRDFYRFAAFFADVREVAVGRQPETPIMTAGQEAELKKLDAEVTRLKGEVAKAKIDADAQAKWEAESAKSSKGLPKPVTDALKVEAGKRTDAQKKTLADHYRDHVAPATESLRKELTAATAKRDAYLKSIPQTLVSMTGPPRPVRVLPRGNWLDDSGELVQPGIPEFLGKLDPDKPTRLDLARWVVSPDNPLTARVFVNRLWKVAFGQGIVRNLDDFGTQGTPPTHPELLDWLATEFVRTGWDVKGTFKVMLMSNAYRQSSVAAKAVREKDPTNLWLARQNRFRIDAEFVRDNALAVAGLLTTKVGGPSSHPYQPAGYWAMLNFPQREWQADKNDDQYRRGLYTYWCRTFPHPSLTAFDAPSREECTNERPRSSTPIQALVLLNDPTYVEAARVFAAAAMKEGKTTPERLTAMYRRALSRPAKPEEIKVLEALLEKHRTEFKADPKGASELLKVGLAPVPANTDAAELAAWTSVARVVLNLHEALTRN